jgi:hypothetical protein
MNVSTLFFCMAIQDIGMTASGMKPVISNKCFIHSPAKQKAKTSKLSFGLINKSDGYISVQGIIDKTMMCEAEMLARKMPIFPVVNMFSEYRH